MGETPQATILLTDDAEAGRHAAARNQTGADVQVREGASGADSLRLANAPQNPDLIVQSSPSRITSKPASDTPVHQPAPPEETGDDSKPKAQTPSAPRPAASHRVLVVDDVVDAADSLTELLGLWGHEARTVHDGPAALAAAREFGPEVILLDLGLPGMDGYEVARRLRRELADRPLRLIAMTGYGRSQDRERTCAAGFDEHLVKPVDLKLLKKMLS